MAKEEIIKALRDLKQKRLFSSEAEKLLAPLKGNKDSFNFEFIESSRTFGRQLDSAYDNGHQLIVKLGEDIESAILIPEENSESLGELTVGHSISMDLKFLGYDSLYQRAVFGKIDSIGKSSINSKTTEAQSLEKAPKGDVNQVYMVPSAQEKSSEFQKENQDEESTNTTPITAAIEENEDSKFKFPKSKLEQKRRAQKTLHKNSEENEKKSTNYHYVILESVPKERFLKPDENEDATTDPRTNITSCISNLVPEFSLKIKNLEMWSIKNFLSLNKGWDEAKRLVDNCPALIKKTSDSLEARVLENELKENKALTNILSHDKFVDIYGDPPKPMLRKMVQIPVTPTVSLNFKTLKRNPKDHLLNLQFMDLISLLLYCFGGIITVFGLNDLSQTLFGSLIFFLGIICHKGVKHFLQDQTAKTDKEEIYGSRWKTSIQYKETKKSLYIKFIGYFFCIIGVIVIWSGITDIKNLILGILSFSFGRWSWPWITKDNQK